LRLWGKRKKRWPSVKEEDGTTFGEAKKGAYGVYGRPGEKGGKEERLWSDQIRALIWGRQHFGPGTKGKKIDNEQGAGRGVFGS